MMLDIPVLELPSHLCITSNNTGGDYHNPLRVLAGILIIKTSRFLFLFFFFFSFFTHGFLLLPFSGIVYRYVAYNVLGLKKRRIFILGIVTGESARKILRSLEGCALSCFRRVVFSLRTIFFNIFSFDLFSCSYLFIWKFCVRAFSSRD